MIDTATAAETLSAFGGDPAAPGTVTLVGGGPGDPGLLTLRAATVLASCDVVAYDRLSPPEALALVPAGAERICVGRRSGESGLGRAAVEAMLVDRARAGRAVVRLKGGDPYVFGRGGEEAAACRAAGIPCEVVAGITSAVAVPGAAGIPVTQRGVAAGFAVVTAHEDPAKGGDTVDYTALARFPGTLVFLMGVAHVRRLASRLLAAGMAPDTPAALVRWGTTARQETLRATLGTVADEVERRRFGSPAVTVVGAAAGLGGSLPDRAERPLHGIRVLVPRTLDRPSRLAARVRSLGGDPVEVPVARVLPGDAPRIGAAVRRLAAGGYAGIALTSPRAVDVLSDALAAAGLDARALAGVRVGTAGSGARRRLEQRLGVRADVVAGSGAALAEAVGPVRGGRGRALRPVPPASELSLCASDRGYAGWMHTPGLSGSDLPGSAAPGSAAPGRFLLLTQDAGDPHLVAGLRRHGHEPEVVTAYRTTTGPDLAPETTDALAEGAIPLVALASSSTARRLADLLGAAGLCGATDLRARAVTIGPRTSAAARAAGIDVHAEADPSDLDGLTAALVKAAAGWPPT